MAPPVPRPSIRGSNGNSGLGSKPTSVASRITSRAPRNGTTRSSDQTNPRTPSIGLRAAEAIPDPAASAAGISRERASSAIVQPGIRLPATPMYPLGPCSTAPGDESRARIRDSAARPNRSKVSLSKDSGASRPDSTGSSPSADSRTAGSPASTRGPCSPSPAGSASRKRSSSGPSSPAGIASSFETVELAVSASWLAVLCGPVDQGITSGAVGFSRAGWLSTIAASSREESL